MGMVEVVVERMVEVVVGHMGVVVVGMVVVELALGQPS